MSAYDQSSTSSGGGEDLKERAKETVAEVDAGAMHVAGVAGDEAGNVAREAKSAARGFLHETRAQLADQASTQQRRAAGAVRSTADELVGMADSGGSNGAAASLVRGLGNQTRQVASWLEEREPADLVQELRGFARRHTGAFVAAAVGLGIVAGRLTRAMMPSGDSGSSSGASGGTAGTTGMGVATGMGGTGLTGAGAGAAMAGGAAYDDAGMGATGATGAMPGSGVGAGDAPIGDALAGEPMGTQSGTNATGGREALVDGEDTASGEWSPSGEAQR